MLLKSIFYSFASSAPSKSNYLQRVNLAVREKSMKATMPQNKHTRRKKAKKKKEKKKTQKMTLTHNVVDFEVDAVSVIALATSPGSVVMP